jgi:protein-S-isoprenylcysteine O-methyltransferase Ste14
MTETEDTPQTEPSGQRRHPIWTIAGWLGIALFVLIYAVELTPHHGRPRTIAWIEANFGTAGLILLNIAVVAAFLALLPYRRPTKGVWKSKGTFLAFVIALMTEMFGWPLLLFLLAPLVEIPRVAPLWFDSVGHWPATVGTAMSFVGLALVAVGWQQIHRAEGLVTGGLYRYMRHPQYTGILLFTLGWIMHWPSVITLMLWPVLAIAYYRLARLEEEQAFEEFGGAYEVYSARTKRFIPFVI